MTDFKPFTWMVWGGGSLSFICGCVVTKLCAKTKILPINITNVKEPKLYSWKLHLLFSFVVFIIFLIGVYGVTNVAGGFILFAKNPTKWMDKDVNYGYYSLLLNFGPLCVLLFGSAVFKKFNSIPWIRIIATIMVLVTISMNFMAYPNRTALFFNIGFFLIMINYLYKRISPLLITAILCLAITAFVIVSNVRNQYGSSVKGKAMDVVMELPYKYVANNYWNLDYALNPQNDNEIHPHTYGIDFFNGIFEYARVSGSFRNSFRWDNAFNKRIQKVFGFNTVNYLWDVYKDLYFIGVIIFPLLCGIALSVLHLKLCKPFTPRQVLFYTYFCYFVGWWFFTSGYKQGVYCIWGILLFFITTVCMRQKRLPAQPIIVNKVDEQNCT